MNEPIPTIQVDTREQVPLRFESYPIETATLPCGDYGIVGFSDWNNPAFIVERKSLGDLIGSLTFGRERFQREVEKLRQFRFRAIVIEAHERQLSEGEYRSQTKPQCVLQSLAALQVRTGIHVIWAGSPEGAAMTIERLVRQFIRGITKDAQRLGRMEARAV